MKKKPVKNEGGLGLFFSFFLSFRFFKPNYDYYDYLIYFKIYCSSAIDFSIFCKPGGFSWASSP